jgi:hypothetical protein
MFLTILYGIRIEDFSEFKGVTGSYEFGTLTFMNEIVFIEHMAGILGCYFQKCWNPDMGGKVFYVAMASKKDRAEVTYVNCDFPSDRSEDLVHGLREKMFALGFGDVGIPALIPAIIKHEDK